MFKEIPIIGIHFLSIACDVYVKGQEAPLACLDFELSIQWALNKLQNKEMLNKRSSMCDRLDMEVSLGI